MKIQIANDKNFERLITENEKVVVKYYANWCGSCRMFKPKYRRLATDERFEGVAFLDVNAEESPETRKLAGVDNLPYFAVFKNGELLEGQATNKEEAVIGLIHKLDQV